MACFLLQNTKLVRILFYSEYISANLWVLCPSGSVHSTTVMVSQPHSPLWIFFKQWCITHFQQQYKAAHAWHANHPWRLPALSIHSTSHACKCWPALDLQRHYLSFSSPSSPCCTYWVEQIFRVVSDCSLVPLFKVNLNKMQLLPVPAALVAVIFVSRTFFSVEILKDFSIKCSDFVKSI